MSYSLESKISQALQSISQEIISCKTISELEIIKKKYLPFEFSIVLTNIYLLLK